MRASRGGSLKANVMYSFTRLPWSDYFDEKQHISVEENEFCVYTAGNEGPYLVLLHGGGHTSLTWSLCAVRTHVVC